MLKLVVRFLPLVTTMVTKVDHSNHRSNHRGYYDGYYDRYRNTCDSDRGVIITAQQ